METKNIHIILIAYYFPPANAIGGARPFRFYKYLKQMGYSCTVITASTEAAGTTDDILVIPDRTGAIWTGEAKARRLSVSAHMERIIRRFVIPACTGVIWSVDVAASCREIIARHRPERRVVVYSTFPPLGVLLAGLMVVVRNRIPWICDFRDPLGLALDVNIYSRFNRFAARSLETMAFRTATAVIANTENIASEWRTLYPWARHRLHVIWNGFDPEQQPKARELPPRRHKVIIHAGELYAGRNPNIILESLARLRTHIAEARRVRIMLVGPIGYGAGIDTSLFEEGTRDGWLDLNRQIPKEDAQCLTEEADGLLLLQPQSAIQVPGKLFDYICIGRPILALVPRFSAVEYILRHAGVPYVCIYSNDDAPTTDRKLFEFIQLPSHPVPFSSWFHEGFGAKQQTAQLSSIIDAIDDASSPSSDQCRQPSVHL